MIRRFWLLLAASALLATSASAATTEFLTIDKIRPGMKGVGRTCYLGNKPEEFQVEILGVLRGIGPGADAVLARMSGGPLERTGVFEGMSGSPVYIDGKLVGAVAFSFPFAKEAIGGITPIRQMVDAFSEPAPGGPGGGARIILKKSGLWSYQLPMPDAGGTKHAIPITPFDTARMPALASLAGHALQPIATPLHLSGFSPTAIESFAPPFKALGMTLLQGTGASAKPTGVPDNTPLEPGANVVVPLVRGDMDASAAGTVTHIEGNNVYAFGHLLFNLGSTELPMHRGRAMTVFPSLQSSFKITETGEPIGTIRQDRNSGIYGILGERAKLIPMNVTMTTSRGAKKQLRYEIARDRFLTPFLVNLTVFNSIVSSDRALGVSTLQVKGKINIKGEQPVELENRFSSDSNSPVFASLSVALPIHFLLSSGFSNLELEGVDLDISALEDDRATVLDLLRLDRSELRAGESVTLDVSYKKNNGEVVQDSFPVKIPTDVRPGTLSMLVADGTSLMAMDAREQGDDFIPRDLTQLIRFMNNIRKNDRLYVRLYRREAGAVIKGEGLPGLPPSILSILRSERNTGGMIPIHTSTFMEYELPSSDYVVTGSKVLELEIKP